MIIILLIIYSDIFGVTISEILLVLMIRIICIQIVIGEGYEFKEFCNWIEYTSYIIIFCILYRSWLSREFNLMEFSNSLVVITISKHLIHS